MIVFGGNDSSSSLNDVWGLALGETPEWTQLVPSGSPPSARSFHNAIYDPVRDRMIVIGGAPWFGGVWGLSLGQAPEWSQLTVIDYYEPHQTAVYDSARDRIVTYWGDLLNGNIVWALSLGGVPQWTQLSPSGPSPSPRYGHTAVYDPIHDRMAVFGGECWGSNDPWVLDWSTPTGIEPPAETTVLANVLENNYPNPFKPMTTIKYRVAEPGRVTLKIYNATGQLLRTLVDEEQTPRTDGFVASWDGTTDAGGAVASGLYFYQLTTKNFSQTKKLILLR